MIPFPVALILSIILDLADFAIVGLIPIVGVGIDIVGSLIIIASVGVRYVVFTTPEYVDLLTLSIPILLPIELFPSYTLAVIVGKAKLLG
ncbi:MAG: hypothetical protein AAB922_04125 [Patescibacteria group bacterium]